MPPGIGYGNGAAPGAPPAGGMRPGATRPQPFTGTQSALNPQDMAQRISTGQIRPDMTVRELLGTMGISPEDTVAEMTQKLRGQAQNATMAGKAQTAAGMRPQAAQPRPAAPAGPRPAPPSPGGLDALIRR